MWINQPCAERYIDNCVELRHGTALGYCGALQMFEARAPAALG
jgi:hypothetical protein